MFSLPVQVLHLHLVRFCFQPYRSTASCILFSHRKLFSAKKSPPNMFIVLAAQQQTSADQQPPGEQAPFQAGQKNPLTPTNIWISSLLWMGTISSSDRLWWNNTTPVWSCKCSCNSTMQHWGSGCWTVKTFFFIHLRATLEHQLVGAEFERNAEVKDLEIRHHCDTVSDLCVTTSLDSCLMGTEHVSLLRLFHNRL